MREPDKTTYAPSPIHSPKQRPTGLRVPLSMYRQSNVEIEVPELTPPGCEPTTISAPTMSDALALKDKAIAHAKRAGSPIYSGENGKQARRNWTSTGIPKA